MSAVAPVTHPPHRRARDRRRDGARPGGHDDPRGLPRRRAIDIPTLCYGETLTPVNACRVCVVEVEGSRVLVPSCARKVEDGMVVQTDSERVRHSRKMVLEFLGSSVDLSTTPDAERWIEEYGADPERYGPPAPPLAAGERDRLRRPATTTPPTAQTRGHRRPAGRRSTTSSTCATTRSASSATSASRAAARTGRTRSRSPSPAAGSTPASRPSSPTPLPDSACVYCGNCIAVCPTGALMFKSEYDMREAGTWDEDAQTVTDDDLPVLRRRLQPRAARAGQRDRQGHVAARPRGHARQPVHQGPVRLPVRAEPRRGVGVSEALDRLTDEPAPKRPQSTSRVTVVTVEDGTRRRHGGPARHRGADGDPGRRPRHGAAQRRGHHAHAGQRLRAGRRLPAYRGHDLGRRRRRDRPLLRGAP